MRLRQLALIFLGLAVLSIAYLAWRSPAPEHDGSNLELHQYVSSPVHLLFFGDSGSGGASQYKLAESMEKYCLSQHPQAVFMLGDNFYPHGVSSTQDEQWQTKFRDAYGKPCLSQLPFYVILGNHDYQGNVEAQIAYSHQQNQWKMPHRFYSVEFGKIAKVIAIDTNVPDLCGSAAHCTFDFLRQALRSPPEALKIVIGHHPIESSSIKYHGLSLLGRFLRSKLCNVRGVYISGHSHHLEHRIDPDCQLNLFISGGGGAELYPVAQGDEQSRFARSENGFLVLKADQKERRFTFFNAQAEPIYEYKYEN
jgi:acid phosphatase